MWEYFDRFFWKKYLKSNISFLAQRSVVYIEIFDELVKNWKEKSHSFVTFKINKSYIFLIWNIKFIIDPPENTQKLKDPQNWYSSHWILTLSETIKLNIQFINETENSLYHSRIKHEHIAKEYSAPILNQILLKS